MNHPTLQAQAPSYSEWESDVNLYLNQIRAIGLSDCSGKFLIPLVTWFNAGMKAEVAGRRIIRLWEENGCSIVRGEK